MHRYCEKYVGSKTDVEFVVARVQPKCRVQGVNFQDPRVRLSGERSALSLLLRGLFDELFFSCILHSLKQNVTDRARAASIDLLSVRAAIRITIEP